MHDTMHDFVHKRELILGQLDASMSWSNDVPHLVAYPPATFFLPLLFIYLQL